MRNLCDKKIVYRGYKSSATHSNRLEYKEAQLKKANDRTHSELTEELTHQITYFEAVTLSID